MPEPFEALYAGLLEQLENIEQEVQKVGNRIKSCVLIVKEVTDKLREYVLSNAFDSENEEIQFFKNIKPQFFCHLHYFLKIYSIELSLPVGNDHDIQNFLELELKAIKAFFDANLGFYKYYRSGSTSLDSAYYLRYKRERELSLEGFYPDIDHSFSTEGDRQVSKILANQMLAVYLKDSLEKHLNKARQPSLAQKYPKSMKWTAPKAALIEIIYSLQSYGAFNNGAAGIKEVATYLQEVFQVELGNYYNCFQEIRLRKKSRTVFLDQLTEKLIQRMDEVDER